MKKLLLLPFTLLAFLFGNFSWSPPKWLVACFHYLKKHLRIALGLFCAALVAIGVTYYIDSLPKPFYTTAEFSKISSHSYNSRTGEEIPAQLDVHNPAKAGTWSWVSDNRLSFKPETPWPAGEQYQVEFDQSIFNDDTLLSDNNFSFSTPELTAHVKEKQFYQDPSDPTIRRES